MLFVILLIGAFVRFYRISATQTFLEDEGRDMLIVQRMIDTKFPVLLGPQTSTGNMYLGPLYYYFITPALIFFAGNPVGPAIWIAITGVATIALLYFVGSKWFGKRAGFVSAILYATLPYPVMFTRNSWNPNLVPLVMTLLLWMASEIKLTDTKKSNYRHIWHFGLLAGVLMQLHYMALVGIGATGLFIVVSNYRAWRKLLVGLLIGLAGVLITLSPFIVFEVRNNYVNSRALIGFLSGKTEINIKYDQTWNQWSANVTKTFVSVVAGQLGSNSFHPESASFILSLMFFAIIALLLLRQKKVGYEGRMVLTILIVSLLILGFYQENIHLHYLGFLLPIIYLIVGMSTTLLPSKNFWTVIALGFVIYNTPTLYSYILSGPTYQVQKSREVAEYIAKRAGGRPYNVVTRQLGQTSPFQYFLAQQKNRPSNFLESTLFVICDGSPCNNDDVTTTLLYLSGPSHPTLASYLWHPQVNEFTNPREMVSNEMVNFGIWVGELKIAKE